MGSRTAIVVAGAALLAACGLSVVGAGDAARRDEATPDGATAIDGAAPGDDDGGSVGIEGGIDADPGCPSECTRCENGTCKIVCIAGTHCAKVVCPPGIPCEVTCVGEDACTKGVDCTQATSCNITCNTGGSTEDPGACRDVQCAGLSCSVNCSGEKACQSELSCDAGTCDITCATKKACCSKPSCNGCSINGPGDGVGGC